MKTNNAKLKTILIIAAFLGVSIYMKLNPDILVSSEFKERMYYDFKSYEEEIEGLDEKLSSIIIANEYNPNKLLLNVKTLNNFVKSKNNAARIGKYSLSYEYYDIYGRYNDNIEYIFQDGIINTSEQEYINNLYDYNKEIIQEFNIIMEPLNREDYTSRQFYKNIINIYEEFSLNADEILNGENYSMLRNYSGDFSDFDTGRAEKFVKDIFSKVVPGRRLTYNNMDDLNDYRLLFATYDAEEEINASAINNDPQYVIEYDKRSSEVYLRLVGRVTPTYVLKEDEVDSIAQDIIKRLNYQGDLYEKTVSNFNIPQLASIKYSYINKKDDVWDKRQDMELELDSYGLVIQLHIFDNDGNVKLDFIEISDITTLIQKQADINDIYKTRNIDGELEYIINVNYKDTDYNLIIDGTTGEFKSSQIDKAVQ
ncbi:MULTISPECIES: hypothetical protein [unclassified Sedimentibacter]|uniref:hypothetical protein n=1 Tax=unclassified Sedimentibacter TaxID=2649220 RepID=UPI0027E1E440|nr:hypothetical protein [Sedimentibacter sp. MB35-C1]WMJ77312.1 hypothetical protein RBQ61_17370 [Sedimentibacter sp. MB35-C1]